MVLPQAILLSVAVLALAGLQPAEAEVCAGNASIDFNGGTLSPYLRPYQSCGSVAVSAGRLVISKPNCVGDPAATMYGTNYKVCGDFDISVDFDLPNFTVPPSGSRWTGLDIFTMSLTHYAIAERYNRFATEGCTPSTSNYKFYTTVPGNCSATLIPTTDTSGKLRIRRTGTTLKFYYWNGSWVEGLTATGTDEPVTFALSSASDGATAQETRFDNLVVVSEPPPVPVTGAIAIAVLGLAMAGLAGAAVRRVRVDPVT